MSLKEKLFELRGVVITMSMLIDQSFGNDEDKVPWNFMLCFWECVEHQALLKR
jgi:hypothetical protein